MSANTPIRPSPIAGTWYPGGRDELARFVDAAMDQAGMPDLAGELVAVIAPHAGYLYSGGVAGHAFAAVRAARQPYDLAVVISPMHQPYYELLLTTAHAAYATPLGDLQVDQDALMALDARLQTRLGYGLTRVGRDREHSLEIELPFLQRAIPGEFRLLPVMMRSQSAADAQALGETLAEVVRGRQAIVVASTDLSHFYDAHTAGLLDAEMMHAFETLDPQEIFQVERSGKGSACGAAAVAAVLAAAKEMGADRVQVLKHATSGDVTGDMDSVVGYCSAAVVRSAQRR